MAMTTQSTLAEARAKHPKKSNMNSDQPPISSILFPLQSLLIIDICVNRDGAKSDKNENKEEEDKL